jgi:hypothetical protein
MRKQKSVQTIVNVTSSDFLDDGELLAAPEDFTIITKAINNKLWVVTLDDALTSITTIMDTTNLVDMLASGSADSVRDRFNSYNGKITKSKCEPF